MPSLAQTTVSGRLTDASEKTPIAGAHIFLKQETSNKGYALTSDTNGKFQFKKVPAGNYQLSISFIGYKKHIQNIKVGTKAIRLGQIKMQRGLELQEVKVVEKVTAAVQKGDTTEFNAMAYKTLPDASAEDLVEKMPTIIIEDGKVQAQGEDVKEVLVDGRPFFGEDPNAALKNLPAEVIDKIQVFDKQSEQAQFTGFDDGESSKTINIITKINMRNGQFGKIYGGYGYQEKYSAGGNINFFNGNRRLSIVGMTNNINKQNFTTEDLLGVVGSSGKGKRGGRGGRKRGGKGGKGGKKGGGSSASDFKVSQQGGITTSNAIGLNYSDKWGRNIDITASYFFSHADNETEQSVEQQYYDSESLQELYEEENQRTSTNINHKFNTTVRYTLDKKNSFVFRPKLTWQGNDGRENIIGQTSLNNALLAQLDNSFNADLSALNFNNFLIWKHRFDTRRRTFSAGIKFGYSPKQGSSYLFAQDSSDPDAQLMQQHATFDQNKWNASANLQYTEPIGQSSMLMLNYRSSFQQETSEKETYDYNEVGEEYDLFNSELSNIFSNDYLTQQAGGGLMYRQGLLMTMVRANVQRADLLNNQTEPYDATTEKTFWNVMPMAMIRYGKKRSNQIMIRYNAKSELPSITKLQNVIDNSNPLQLSVGNPELNQSLTHRLYFKYSKTNTEKSSIFFFMLSGNYTQDYIANSTYLSAKDFPDPIDIEVLEGAQISRPTNVDGYYNLRSFLTYGFPIKLISSNLNIDLAGNYTHSPGLINGEKNWTNTTATGLGFTLSSNLARIIDFKLSSRTSYNISNNTLQEQSNTTYLNQKTHIKFKMILNNGFLFRTDVTHQLYEGLSSKFNSDYLLVNASIGMKLFKNKRGEISLSVFDLMKQNTSLSRNVTESYTEDIQTNTLQQYFMLSFRYDIRRFISEKDLNFKRKKREDHERWGKPF